MTEVLPLHIYTLQVYLKVRKQILCELYGMLIRKLVAWSLLIYDFHGDESTAYLIHHRVHFPGPHNKGHKVPCLKTKKQVVQTCFEITPDQQF